MIPKIDELSYEACRQGGCPTCGAPLRTRSDRQNQVYVGGSGHMDDISEEIDTLETEQLFCEQCNRVVAERFRQVHINRSYYSLRQDVEHGDWQYAPRA